MTIRAFAEKDRRNFKQVFIGGTFMKGWKIFTQSLRLVFANLKEALRISLVPYLVASAAMAWFLTTNADFLASEGGDSLAGFNGLSLLVFVIVGMVCYLWIAVAWHRYVLLREEGEGWVAQFRSDRILGYLGRGILLGLVLILPAIFMAFVVGALSVAGGLVVMIASGLIFTFAFTVIVYRLSPILPAAALGEPLKMNEAWEKTKGAGWDIALLALITAVINVIIQSVGEIGGNPGAPLAVIYMVVTGWLQFMVGLSILTTIYGHYVEGRSID
ncbi:hypothetical protein CVM39_13420 [Pseudooceanicola antarcticus]|uniref:Membrane domain of glycerophosphoryl diester phosphodiesterase n=1 Tax=Pseudooceanicola antarcticus TaxID=1247613 RepID=A0ABX4ML17_9RHOB|nr:hypothetical protein CVM39_13420 [Pseudooceanicola antarcticus]